MINGRDALLKAITSSPSVSTIDGYFLHSRRFLAQTTEMSFWRTQAAIICAMHAKHSLTMFVAHIHSECDWSLVVNFKRSLQRVGWIMNDTSIDFASFGDSVCDSASFVIGINRSSTAVHQPVVIPHPPVQTPKVISDFVYTPFNRKELSVAPSCYDPEFAGFPATATLPIATDATLRAIHSKRLYNIRRSGDDSGITAGSGVYSVDGICPPFTPLNPNIFGSSFGIEFSIQD